MIHFTEHAKERMAQRNIREEIITENLEMFYRYGFWNDRGDRLTLNTKSEIIHNMIKMKQHMLLIVKQKLQALKHKSLSENKDSVESSVEATTVAIRHDRANKRALLTALYKRVNKKLKALQRLERKEVLTLVLRDDHVITVYKKVKRDKANTEAKSKRSRSLEKSFLMLV